MKVYVDNYLKKEHVKQELELTIAGVEQTALLGRDGETKERYVLCFAETPLRLVLNKTNLRRLITAYGDETEDWKGRSVRLYADDAVEYAGKAVGGIRVECV